jgi:hypothetical protein
MTIRVDGAGPDARRGCFASVTSVLRSRRLLGMSLEERME